MTIICETSVTWITWLILYLIANSLVSVVVTLITWWMVLVTIFWLEQIWAIDIVMLFLIDGQSCNHWLCIMLNEKQSGKISTNWNPGVSFLCSEV